MRMRLEQGRNSLGESELERKLRLVQPSHLSDSRRTQGLL